MVARPKEDSCITYYSTKCCQHLVGSAKKISKRQRLNAELEVTSIKFVDQQRVGAVVTIETISRLEPVNCLWLSA